MKQKKLNNLKLENKTVGLRKKLGIIAVIFLLIFAAGVTSATIRLKDPSGATSGYWGDGDTITTSNGDSWTITGTNLQTAIYSMNNESGWVKVWSDISLSSGITMGKRVILDFQHHNVTPTSSFDMITMKPYCTVKNMIVNLTVTDFTDTILFFNGSDIYDYYEKRGSVEDITVISHDKQGTFVEMVALDGTQHVAFFDFSDLHGYSMEYMIHMNASNSGAGIAWINNNNFNNIFGATIDHFIFMNRTGPGTTQIVENRFTEFCYTFGSGSQEMIYCEGDMNHFVGFSSDYSAGPEYELINVSGIRNYILTNVEYSTCSFDNVSNTGDKNRIIDVASWYVDWEKIYSHGDIKIYSELYLDFFSGNALRLQADAYNDIWAFSNSAEGETKFIYVYGYRAGESKDSLRFGYGINSQDASFITSEGGIIFKPNDDNITIEDVLTLNPRTTEPLGPTEGMLYVNSTDHHCYCYLNSAWKQLDN